MKICGVICEYNPFHLGHEYQLREKMNIACHLLSGTHLAVSEVAVAIGYHDARYFSGLFRRRCGLSPRAFRNSQKQNNPNNKLLRPL